MKKSILSDQSTGGGAIAPTAPPLDPPLAVTILLVDVNLNVMGEFLPCFYCACTRNDHLSASSLNSDAATITITGIKKLNISAIRCVLVIFSHRLDCDLELMTLNAHHHVMRHVVNFASILYHSSLHHGSNYRIQQYYQSLISFSTFLLSNNVWKINMMINASISIYLLNKKYNKRLLGLHLCFA